jgi:hypothetical protein
MLKKGSQIWPKDVAHLNVRVEEEGFPCLHQLPTENMIFGGPEIFGKETMSFKNRSPK